MKIVTISREYGAGGHSIGTKVAEKLGVEFYDKDIIMNVVKESGYDKALVEADNEEITPGQSFIRAITPQYYDPKDEIYECQKKAILELAAKGPCVILGRCADIILAEAGYDALDVFIYADSEHRKKRVGELIESDDEAVINKAIKKTDHNRHSYYSYYSGQHWGDYHNYEIMLDSGALGYEKCIEMICTAAKGE